jgi:sec-independent protein translocase protein TatA
MPGMGELIIILLIVLVVFGANKLPSIGDALGRSIKNFKRSSKVDGEDDDDKDKDAGKGELAEKKPAQLEAKPQQKQLEASGDDGGEWEEVVVRRRKKSASSNES